MYKFLYNINMGLIYYLIHYVKLRRTLGNLLKIHA